MHRILLAEDDDAIVRLLTDFLREEGFAVTAAAGERSAREALERERFDLALVDLQLADGSGFGVCAAARARQLPVIFLTASSDESTVVSGFDMGADDYVAKPFRPRELVSRIRQRPAPVRQGQGSGDPGRCPGGHRAGPGDEKRGGRISDGPGIPAAAGIRRQPGKGPVPQPPAGGDLGRGRGFCQ